MNKQELSQALADLQEEKLLALVKQELDAGADAMELFDACREGMNMIGQRFESGEYYISDLMYAAEIFKQVQGMLEPLLKAGAGAPRGKVVMGTVKGDIHDIGKNLVIALLRAANYDVTDMGVDVPPARFVEALKETGAGVLGLSGLLTTAFESMKDTVAAVDDAGLRPKVKIMIGGGMVNEVVCTMTKADAWGANAQAAVHLCNQWVDEGGVK